jgi:Ca2+-binding EF-hand superfamily protein
MKLVKKVNGLLKVTDLLNVLNFYDKSITLKNVWLIVSFFGFPIKKDDSIKYEEFRTDFKNFMEKFELRTPEALDNFLTESTTLNKPSPANSNTSTPMASRAELKLPAESKAHSLLSILRQRLKILNEEDARDFFKRADTNHSGTLSLEEFLEYARVKLPEATKEAATDMFRLLDKRGQGLVDQPAFVQTMTKEVELTNRLELLAEKTVWAASLFQKISEYPRIT